MSTDNSYKSGFAAAAVILSLCLGLSTCRYVYKITETARPAKEAKP